MEQLVKVFLEDFSEGGSKEHVCNNNDNSVW